MRKLLIGAATAVAFALPVAASAATSITFLTFPNSGPNATIAAGDTVDTKVTFDLTGTSELESMSLQIVDNAGNNIGMPETCFDVADRVVSGTFTRVGPFETTGGTEGTFGIRVRGYGVTGPGTDNNCGGTVNDNQYFSNRLTLTESQNTGNNANNTGNGGSGGNTGGTGGSGMPSWFTAFWASFQSGQCVNSGGTWANGACTHTTPAPTGNAAKCAAIAAYVNAPANTYSSVGVQLQSALLLDNPNSIPALAAGATIPMGYFGPQTHAALYAYNAAYGCH